VLLSDAIDNSIEARRLVNSSEKTIANLKPDRYQFLEYVNHVGHAALPQTHVLLQSPPQQSTT